MSIIAKQIRTVLFQGRFYGDLQIQGTTKNAGTPNTPVRRRVRLHDQSTGLPIREVWSDAATGAYSFDLVSPGTYYVTSFDYTGEFNGVIQTDVTLPP